MKDDPSPRTYPLHTAYVRFGRAEEIQRRAGENEGTDPETGLTYEDGVFNYHEALLEALRLYSSPPKGPDGQAILEPFPPKMAHHLAAILEDLMQGILPGDFDQYRDKGRPSAEFARIESMKAASRYLAAVQAGWVTDRRAVAHLAEQFGVDRQTIHRWKRDSEAETFLSPDQAPPGVLVRLGNQGFVEWIVSQMKFWAGVYQTLNKKKSAAEARRKKGQVGSP